MDEQKKFCLECAFPIKGRSDKKFCCDSCRNSFHNRRNNDVSAFMKRVDFSLRKNRRILSEFFTQQKTAISRNQLSIKGFDFEHYTATATRESGGISYFCYDLGYIFSGPERIELIRESPE